MVHTNEVANLMDQMMKVNIFEPSDKLRMIKDEDKTFLDPNVLMDTRHRILRENLSASTAQNSIWTEAKKLFTQEEATQSYVMRQHRFLQRELKKFENELTKTRPKFMKSYSCSRRNLAPSDDEEFWTTSTRRQTAKVFLEEKRAQRFDDFYGENEFESAGKNTRINSNDSSRSVEEGNYLVTKKSEAPCIGSIKVTIKDKGNNRITGADRLHLLRKYFDVLKRNAVAERRLREIRMKIEENVARRVTRMYFDLWRTRVKDAKKEEDEEEGEKEAAKAAREISEERKIEMFISAITERQKELMKNSRKRREKDYGNSIVKESSDANARKRSACRKRIIVVEPPAQSRLNAQRRIIETQKAKLAEQGRIIEELRLKQVQNEITKANKETMDVAREALDNCSRGTRNSLIRLMHRNGYRDDESLVLPNRSAAGPPRFLRRMEARAEARRERMKRMDELHRSRLEEARRKEEAARTEEEQRKKRLQQEAEAEARRSRRELEENRRVEREKLQRLNGIADEFYRRYLLRCYAMKPFAALLQEKRINTQIAEDYCREKLLARVFDAWRREVETRSRIRSEIAVSTYNKCLTRRSFGRWKEAVNEANSMCQVAMDFYDMKLLERYLRLWLARVLEYKADYMEKKKAAERAHEIKLKANYFGKWRKYLTIVDDIKESERRRNELRLLVQEMIPDFNPKQRGVALED